MLGKGLASKSALCEIGHGTSDPAGAKQLANRISDVSTEKPTPIGLAPKTAAAISGKVYRFPPNPTNIKSVSLILTDPQPRYDTRYTPTALLLLVWMVDPSNRLEDAPGAGLSFGGALVLERPDALLCGI
jgi:hypothetical protein